MKDFIQNPSSDELKRHLDEHVVGEVFEKQDRWRCCSN